MPIPYRYRVVALCTIAFFSTMVARVVISPVVPDLQIAFAATTGAIGLALSGMWVAYALMQYPSGVLADRYGERIVVLVAVAATGLTSLLLAVSPTYAWFVVLAVALGGSAGLVYSAATSLVTKQSRHTGRAIGVYIAGGPIAGLLAPPGAAAIGLVFDWRVSIALGAIVAVPSAVAVWRGLEPTPPARAEQAPDPLDVLVMFDLLKRPVIAHTLVLSVLGAFTWQATASFLPAFLETFHGVSRSTASLLFSAYFVVHGTTQPLTGMLSDRLSRAAAAFGTMALGVLGYGLLVIAESPLVIGLAIVAIGTAMSWGAPLQSRLMDNLSAAEQGTGFGLVRMMYMSLGAAGSLITGIVVDLAGWGVAFALLAGCMALGSAMLAITLIRRHVAG